MQTRAYISDQVGGYTLTWADRGQVWAELKPLDKSSDDKTPPMRYRMRCRGGVILPFTARLNWRDQNFKFLSHPQVDIYRKWVSAIIEDDVRSA